MRLKRFNESSTFDKYFTIPLEEIEDVAIPLTDIGWTSTIRTGWISAGPQKRTQEPTSKKATPYYVITLQKGDDACSGDIRRWDGSYYLDTKDTLRAFTTFLSRLEKYGSIYYHISNRRYTCEIHLPEIEVEIGFDWSTFENDLNKIIRKIEKKGYFLETHTSGYNTSIDLEFKIPYRNDDITKISSEITQDSDNKEGLSKVKSEIESFLKPYSKEISYSVRFTEEHSMEITKKTGFMKKEKYKYTFYTIFFKIRRKETRRGGLINESKT